MIRVYSKRGKRGTWGGASLTAIKRKGGWLAMLSSYLTEAGG